MLLFKTKKIKVLSNGSYIFFSSNDLEVKRLKFFSRDYKKSYSKVKNINFSENFLHYKKKIFLKYK